MLIAVLEGVDSSNGGCCLAVLEGVSSTKGCCLAVLKGVWQYLRVLSVLYLLVLLAVLESVVVVD